ncbi:MAG: hypothetical protein JSS66_01885 [Armatimonadetes bacterium]|nr:hypothetical protein [Armatimonadota bacterium]
MKLVWAAFVAFSVGTLAAKAPEFAQSMDVVSVGREIHPVGDHVGVGSYPIHFAVSPDGRYMVVSTMGFREHLSLIRLSDGKLLDQVDYNGKDGDQEKGMYFGLAFDAATYSRSSMPPRLYVSEGARDRVSIYDIVGEKLVSNGVISDPAPQSRNLPYHFSGLEVDGEGHLVVVNNQTGFSTNYKGSVSIYDLRTKSATKRIDVGGFPYDVAIARGKAYVSCERDGTVNVIDLAKGLVVKSIRTGQAPANLIASKEGSKVFVSNSASDTVSVIDTGADKVVSTTMLRPSELRGLPGVTPLGLWQEGTALYVACAGLNAVAIVDLDANRVKGYVPTGWYPTDVCVTGESGNKTLVVASAKGVKAKQPNKSDVNGWGTYIQNIYEGTVSRVSVPDEATLANMTSTVMAANYVRPGLDKETLPGFNDPGIEHVIYVIKENRTYDNVLGDMPQGNGDPTICLFPREVTPNLHALAERFVLLDNFHVCAEVSQDGWVWSTAGMISAYASRNTPYNYSGRGRDYDTEGSNNGIPVDLIGLPDVARPPSGYLWDHCAKHGVSFRNYGFYSQFQDPEDKRNDIMRNSHDNTPTKKALLKTTDLDFRRYDLSYPDGEAYERHGFTYPKQRASFGKFGAKSRFSEWKREFDEFVKTGKVPKLMFIRFGTDHTAGTQEGMPSAKAMVADNDYAVGQLVDAVSHSPIWSKTAICILEDDAQAGLDHVDAHRSTAYVVSPFIAKGTVDSHFYNTDSMLRTMELLLGLPPMSQFDATAAPIGVFGPALSNAEPYNAILPPRDIVCKANVKGGYRSNDSLQVSWYGEESKIDEELNDILWVSIKGTPYPGAARSQLPRW